MIFYLLYRQNGDSATSPPCFENNFAIKKDEKNYFIQQYGVGVGYEGRAG
jgi:hypothetical protein